MRKQCCKYTASAYITRGFEWFFEIFSTVVGYILFTPLFVLLLIILVACRVTGIGIGFKAGFNCNTGMSG